MLNGKKVKVGEVVKRDMFTNWTFEYHKEYKITEVGEMDENGWFDIKVEGVKDWACCIGFSILI